VSNVNVAHPTDLIYNLIHMATINSAVNISGLRHPGTIPAGLKVSVGKSIRPAIQRIVDELKPEKIVLFGSYAYGRPNPHSDVDLLVVMKTNASLKERSWKVSRLLLPRPFPVDILVKTPKEIETALKSGDFFLKEILSRGKVLYERNK
jgi:predicted nucleotidyltransferase